MMKLQKKFLINKKNSIEEAMKKIKINGSRTLLVIEKNSRLIGTLSEGDIQKALIINSDVSVNISKIYNKKPKNIKEGNIENSDIANIFIEGQYGILPVVDKNKKLKKIITWSDIFRPDKNHIKLKNIDVVIMAGGKGERLRPYTQILPKPLVPINNKPMLEHIIENFQYFNFNKFHLILNHQANLIKSYFDNIKKNLKINYIKEPKVLGTAGGLRYLNKISSDDFIVANCDTLFKINYAKLYKYHKQNNNLMTVVVSNSRHTFQYGFCKTNKNKLLSIVEKPKFNFTVNTGLYLFNKKIIKLIPKGKKFDMTDLIKKCLDIKKNINVFKISPSSWNDLGQIKEFTKISKNYHN